MAPFPYLPTSLLSTSNPLISELSLLNVTIHLYSESLWWWNPGLSFQSGFAGQNHTDHPLPHGIVALSQQYLGARPAAPQSSGLSTSIPWTYATDTLQYLPAEASVIPDLKESPSDDSDIPTLTTYQRTDVEQEGLPELDDFHPRQAFSHTASESSWRGFLPELWLSFHQKVRFLLQLCKEKLDLPTGTWCESLPNQNGEEVLDDDGDLSWQYAWPGAKLRPADFEGDENLLSRVPQYVVDHAPLVHLYSGEKYWPCDMGEHLHHVTPELNFTPVQAGWQHPGLNNLSDLNRWEDARYVFLTSDDNVEDHPAWLMGEKNIPVAPTGSEWQVEDNAPPPAAKHPLQAGRSDAPAVLVMVNKGNGVVDAFWFFFYSFNLGNTVILRFGNHVGDWEHTVVRFHNGKPKAIFFSEHYFGQAYSYRAVEKVGKRPVVYSAVGTHAMYATPGTHSYILPWGLLHDQTDQGPLWDPTLNLHMYTYDLLNDTLRPSNFTPEAPTDWFHFSGHWGDKQYRLDDSRQYLFAGNYHYVSGPLGPKFKNLGRRKICQGRESERCEIRNWLGGSRLRRVPKAYRDEEWSGVDTTDFRGGLRSFEGSGESR